MATLNKVLMIGNLTRDPEVRYLPSGSAVADLRMAVNRRYRTQSGEDREETCFVQVAVFGKQAETTGKYLKKGSPALIEGRLRYEEWEKDNQKHSRISVVAERVQFLSSPRRDGDYGDAPGRAPAARRSGPDTPPAAPEAPQRSGPDAAPAAPDTPPSGSSSNEADRTDDEDLPF